MSFSLHRNNSHASINGLSAGYSQLNYNDQTEEEKKVAELKVKERELLRTLNLCVVNSEEYNQTLIELISIINLIKELEKIIQEQKVQGEWDQNQQNYHEKEGDFQKKKIEIANRLRNSAFPSDLKKSPLLMMQPGQNVNKWKKSLSNHLRQVALGPTTPLVYNKNEGFGFTFDWIVGLPQKYHACQVVYATFVRGEMITSPNASDLVQCNTIRGHLNQCVINFNACIFDVNPNMDTLFILELQSLFDKEVNDNKKTEIIGWTIVDLFDMMKALK